MNANDKDIREKERRAPTTKKAVTISVAVSILNNSDANKCFISSDIWLLEIPTVLSTSKTLLIIHYRK